MPRSLIRDAKAWLADHGNVQTTLSIRAGLASLAATVVRPLCGALPKGHDTLLHYYRITQINALWQRGVFFSRWSPDLMLGYGYPLFHFYPPLSAYLLTLIYWLIGQNAPVAMSALLALSLLAACLGMFRLGRELYGPTGGLFSAAAYTLSPYLLYQIFERSSISNALAMALFPWAAWALVKVARVPTARRVALAALPIAAVLLSHVAASLLFMAPLAIWGAAAAWGGARRWRTISARGASVLLTLLGGTGLAAFFWLPASAEYRYTVYGAAIAAPDVDLRLNFASLLSWPDRVVAGVINPALPMTVGIAQLALGTMAFLLALCWLLCRRDRSGRFSVELLTLIAALNGLALAFLATPLSTPLWEHIGLLRNVQWPWRCLDVASFFLALACGRLAHGVRPESPRSLATCGRLLLLGAGMVVFFVNAVPYMYPPRWQSLPTRPTLADAAAAQAQWDIYGLTSWEEYAPITAPLSPAVMPRAADELGATLDAKLRLDDLPAGALLESSGGALWARASLSLPAPMMLTWNTFFFPGWHARIDGHVASLGADDLGRLSLAIPAGAHTVEVAYGRTPLQSVADALSLVAAVLILLALVWRRRISPIRDEPLLNSRPAAKIVSVRNPAFLLLGGLLCVLAVGKFAWLDRFDSPLVRYLRGGQIQGAESPGAGDFGGEIRLVGYDMEKPDLVALYWQAQRAPSADFATEVTLYDARGAPLQKITHTHPGYNLVSRWEPGWLIRDEFALSLSELARPGGYRLTVALLDPPSGAKLPLLDLPEGAAREAAIGTLKLAPDRVQVSDATPVNALFGGVIELERVRVSGQVRRGSALDLAFIWRSRATTQTDYTVFVHVLRPDGTLAAGQDAQPRAGLYPTSFWSPGEAILDERHWLLDLPPGEYDIEVGLYDLANGTRLPVVASGTPAGDHLILGKVRVSD